jgi:hypothetical protein
MNLELNARASTPLHSTTKHTLHNAYQAHHWCTSISTVSNLPATEYPKALERARIATPKNKHLLNSRRCSVEDSSSIFPSPLVCWFLDSVKRVIGTDTDANRSRYRFRLPLVVRYVNHPLLSPSLQLLDTHTNHDYLDLAFLDHWTGSVYTTITSHTTNRSANTLAKLYDRSSTTPHSTHLHKPPWNHTNRNRIQKERTTRN